jgi:exopolyphosphatase / guanosine-5'-triphosphate,3'-diphosphate pyrophosphatase
MLGGVIDVGANTVRLQISRGTLSVDRSKAMLRLGEAIERHGRLPEEKLEEATRVVARFAEEARRRGVGRLEVLVTSPGRQAANADELVARLTRAAAAPVRVLDATEEGRLAFVGATALSRGSSKGSLAVVDVGGGSAQIAVGTRRDGPSWVRSLDIGSVRLTSRMGLADPPGVDALAAARSEVRRHLDGITPPLPHAALAVGGSARALEAIGGSKLGSAELDHVVAQLAVLPAAQLVHGYGIDPDRVPTLAAGAVILAAIRDLLCVPFRVGRGGVREGALLELAGSRQAA